MVSALELQLRQSSSNKVIPGQKPFGRVIETPTRITSSQAVILLDETPQEYEIIKTKSGVPRFVRYREASGKIRQEPLYTIHQDVEGQVSYFENPNIPTDISSQISLTFPEPTRRWELSGSDVIYGSFKKPATVVKEGITIINPELPSDIRNQLYIEPIKEQQPISEPLPVASQTTVLPTTTNEQQLKTSPQAMITYPLYEAGSAAGESYRDFVSQGKQEIELTFGYLIDFLDQLIPGTKAISEPAVGVAKPFYEFTVGAAQLPAGLVEFGTILPPAIEYNINLIAREPEKYGAVLTGGAELILQSIQQSIQEKPFETLGETTAMFIVGGRIGRGRVGKVKTETVKPAITSADIIGVRPSPAVRTTGVSKVTPTSRVVESVSRQIGVTEAKPAITPSVKVKAVDIPDFIGTTERIVSKRAVTPRVETPETIISQIYRQPTRRLSPEELPTAPDVLPRGAGEIDIFTGRLTSRVETPYQRYVDAETFASEMEYIYSTRALPKAKGVKSKPGVSREEALGRRSRYTSPRPEEIFLPKYFEVETPYQRNLFYENVMAGIEYTTKVKSVKGKGVQPQSISITDLLAEQSKIDLAWQTAKIEIHEFYKAPSRSYKPEKWYSEGQDRKTTRRQTERMKKGFSDTSSGKEQDLIIEEVTGIKPTGRQKQFSPEPIGITAIRVEQPTGTFVPASRIKPLETTPDIIKGTQPYRRPTKIKESNLFGDIFSDTQQVIQRTNKFDVRQDMKTYQKGGTDVFGIGAVGMAGISKSVSDISAISPATDVMSMQDTMLDQLLDIRQEQLPRVKVMQDAIFKVPSYETGARTTRRPSKTKEQKKMRKTKPTPGKKPPIKKKKKKRVGAKPTETFKDMFIYSFGDKRRRKKFTEQIKFI